MNETIATNNDYVNDNSVEFTEIHKKASKYILSADIIDTIKSYPGLTSSQRLVAEYIYQLFCRFNLKDVFPSQEKIAKAISVTRQTVNTAINKLKKIGFLQTVKHPKFESLIYILKLPTKAYELVKNNCNKNWVSNSLTQYNNNNINYYYNNKESLINTEEEETQLEKPLYEEEKELFCEKEFQEQEVIHSFSGEPVHNTDENDVLDEVTSTCFVDNNTKNNNNDVNSEGNVRNLHIDSENNEEKYEKLQQSNEETYEKLPPKLAETMKRLGDTIKSRKKQNPGAQEQRKTKTNANVPEIKNNSIQAQSERFSEKSSLNNRFKPQLIRFSKRQLVEIKKMAITSLHLNPGAGTYDELEYRIKTKIQADLANGRVENFKHGLAFCKSLIKQNRLERQYGTIDEQAQHAQEYAQKYKQESLSAGSFFKKITNFMRI